ncbi:MaoC family dehydratase [Oceanicoccus sp. KOV_DT_Chl]|uniref:MaoC family dehydratase n=1 Tax=Oceanicoccus sp. KOV_DT_Chl TaxID=1904639 RepID=UPI000C7A09D6|nr:MaoC family dehydratase [Oceanicoccus sp. KOV_DT_Chl]
MKSLRFDQISEGDTLPALEIDVSTSLIVATAIASRDYQNVHHDRDQAVELGSKDIFMNILTTNGLVGRFVTDWSGPLGLLKRINIRLGVPNYAGDKMVLTGTVGAKRVAAGENIIDINVVGKNSLGDHVTGMVEVALP